MLLLYDMEPREPLSFPLLLMFPLGANSCSRPLDPLVFSKVLLHRSRFFFFAPFHLKSSPVFGVLGKVISGVRRQVRPLPALRPLPAEPAQLTHRQIEAPLPSCP